MTIKLFFSKFCDGSAMYAALLLAWLATGCAVQETPKLPITAMPEVVLQTPVALTAEAGAALQAAEQSVIEARVKRALWIVAVEELSRARASAKAFDSAATLRHAREAILLCELSIAQLSKAPVKW